jgi:LCP family protein required for cell wall assembly
MNSRFRSPDSSSNHRRTMDGIINAPTRQYLGNNPLQGRGKIGRDELRTNTRTIGDFRKPEGYHQSNGQSASRGDGAASAPTPESPSLQSTLPSGRLRRGRHMPGGPGKRDWLSIRKWSLRSGLAVLAILIVLGGFLFTKGFFKINKVFKGGGSAAALENNVNPSRLKGEGDGRVNVLLMGRGGEGHDGADLTDTILVASIDPVNKKAALISIPRDLWVSTDRGGHSKINAVFAAAKNASLYSNPKDKAKADAAGVAAVETAVKDVLDIPIHYYGLIDFTAFKQAVDTVGGVDMNVPQSLAVTERMWDPTVGKPYFLNVPAGQQHFDGTRALFFTRSRHTSTRGDFDRSERQRLFIAALSQKIFSAGTYTNPLKISQLMDAFGNHVATDLSVNDAMRLSTIGKSIGGNFESIGLADPPGNFLTTGMINGQSVVKPAAGIDDYTQIHTFVRSKLQDGYILKENAAINILNGTVTSGLAGERADVLKQYGYTIGTVGDAPTQTYEKTVLVDLTNGKKPYTKNYLEKRLNVKATTTLPDKTIQPGNASFVIILGSNETLNR